MNHTTSTAGAAGGAARPKRVAAINDLSGLGRCSLTAALPILSVLGVQACPLPTAVLSNQTCYDSFAMVDLTDRMPDMVAEWKKRVDHFDGVYTGFLANPGQVDTILRFIDVFAGPQTLLLVDPVMGDEGTAYPTTTRPLFERLQVLVRRAQVITPNLTEACILTGTPFESLEEAALLEQAEDMAQTLLGLGPQTVVVTGIRTGAKLYNLALSRETRHLCETPIVGGGYSGTGDILASILCGCLVQGRAMAEALELATRFITRGIRSAYEAGTDPNDGIDFENCLPMLLDKLPRT